MTLKLIFIVLILSNLAYGQSVADQLDSLEESSPEFLAPDLSTEKIEKISASGRIFILTNGGNAFGKGDFISMVLDNKLINRALVAKTVNGSGGVKILKVYDQKIHRLLKPGMEVQIIQGDDSYFNKMNTPEVTEEAPALIEDETELFDETTLLDDDISLEENTSREIKTDNIISLFISQVEGQSIDQGTRRYSQLSGAWAYQLKDNIWGEVSYGENIINDYPSGGLDTKFSSLVIKLKYTVKAPLYSFIQPYAGYKIRTANSPGAGTPGVSPEQQEDEINLVSNLESKGAVFGVTLLKRLVPGWFARLDVGSDALNFGFSLEF